MYERTSGFFRSSVSWFSSDTEGRKGVRNMAKIKLGPNVMDMRGKVGQLVYSIWKSGMSVMRAAAQVVRNPSSPAQVAVRQAQRELGNVWKGLTDMVHAEWGLVAEQGAKRTNPEAGIRALIRTPEGKFTGFNAFMEANQLARTVGASANIEEPQKQTLPPNGPPDLAAAFDGAKVTVTWGDIPDVTPSQFVRVWIYSEQRMFHKQLIDFAPGAAKTINITQARGENGTPIDMAFFTNSAVLIQADTVDQASGWVSNPSATKRLYLEAPEP